MFAKRIGPHPHANDPTSAANGCPDIWELKDGRFAVIGIEATSLLRPHLPDDANCGPDENIVIIDRHILLNAKSHIPAS